MKKRLEEICVPFKSDILVNKIEQDKGIYPLFGAKGLVKTIDYYLQDKQYISIVKWGAGVGRVTIHPAYSSIVATMQGILPQNDISINWLCYLLKSMHLEQYSTSAVVPNLYYKDYCKTIIDIPSKTEQTIIANILGMIQSVINLRMQQLQHLDELIKARFVEMFGDNKYQLVKTSDICDFITKGTTPSTNEIFEEYSEGMIPYLKVYNLSFNGDLLFKQTPQFIPKATHDGKLSRSKVFPNDVLMNIVGPPLGKFSVVTNEYPEWNINQAIAIFRAKEKVIPQYLMLALMQPDVLRPFLEQAVGVRQQNLSLEQCRNLKIPLPPVELQRQFSAFIEQVDKSKVVVQKALDEAQLLFDSLMQKYFG